MEKTIALIPGDGIGPDVVAEGVNVLNAVAKNTDTNSTTKMLLPAVQPLTSGESLFRRTSLIFVLTATLLFWVL